MNKAVFADFFSNDGSAAFAMLAFQSGEFSSCRCSCLRAPAYSPRPKKNPTRPGLASSIGFFLELAVDNPSILGSLVMTFAALGVVTFLCANHLHAKHKREYILVDNTDAWDKEDKIDPID